MSLRIATVDLGTNSVRYDIYEMVAGKPAKALYREKEMIRLGEGLFRTGEVSTGALERLLTSLSHFSSVSERFHVDHTEAFATCALREAQESAEIRRLIKRNTGFHFNVISGEEEAKLIAAGVLSNDKRCRGRFGLIDIGGGSTEISLCENRERLDSISLPLGVARIQQCHLLTIPPANLKSVTQFFQQVRPLTNVMRIEKLEMALGSSGSVKALSRIHRKLWNEEGITLKGLNHLCRQMETLDEAGLMKIPGMVAKRVPFILSGALSLRFCMEILKIKKVFPTPFALRDGLVLQLAERYGASAPSGKF